MARLAVAELDTSRVQGTLSETFLSWIGILDDFGASSWNLRHVSVVTAIVLAMIHFILGEYKGIKWNSLLFAIVSGYGALMAMYLSVVAAEDLTGTTEPLRSIRCQGALTSLHRIIPAMTQGYAILDLIDGLTVGTDFILHGVFTFFVMGYFCELGVSEIILPMLLMEISTVHLMLVKAEGFSDTATALNIACFILSFFAVRIFYVPYNWYIFMKTLLQENDSQVSQSCLPWHVPYVVFVVGLFFHGLNAYWGYKIIRKLMRKISGNEKLRDNDLKEDKKKM